MTINTALLAFLAFIAALLFFLVATFGGSLGDTNLLYAGLSSLATGFVLDHLPG